MGSGAWLQGVTTQVVRLIPVLQLLLNTLYTYKYCCWQGYPSTYCFSYVKPYVFKKVIIIVNENGDPPE